MKLSNLNIKQKLLAVLLSGTIAFSAIPGAALAEKKAHGAITLAGSEQSESDLYHTITAVKGDHLSRISEYICTQVYGIEPTTKYWPVLAFMNGYDKVKNKVMQPGDEIKFPLTVEEAEARLEFLKKSGLYGQYVRSHGIYKTKFTVRMLLEDIYAKQGVCVDPDFIDLYLKTIGQDGKFDADTVIKTTDDLWYLTEWIPSLEQLYNWDFSYEDTTGRLIYGTMPEEAKAATASFRM